MGNPITLAAEFDTISEARIPIDLESIRIGIRGEIDLFTNVIINARLGLAHWKYGEFTPQSLTNMVTTHYSGESGNDIYYSVGAEYKFTEHFYIGLEYSLLTVSETAGDQDTGISSYKHDVKDLSLILGWAF